MARSFPDFNLYEELEISRRASQEVVEAAYRRLARRYHPDSGEAPDPVRMVRLNQAFGVLGDANERARYDREQTESRSSPSSPSPPPPREPAGHDTPPATSKTPPTSSPSPVGSSHHAAGWWENNHRWAIGLALTLGVGLLTSYGRSQTAQDSIRAQNDAALTSPSPTSGGASGSRSAFALRVGDCISDALPGAPQPVATVRATPCSSSEAKWQVSSSFVVSSAGYPAASYFSEQGSARCADATSSLYPTSESWAAGDRTVACLRRFSASSAQSVPENAAPQNSPPGTTNGGAQTSSATPPRSTPSAPQFAPASSASVPESTPTQTSVAAPPTAVPSGACSILSASFPQTEANFLRNAGLYRVSFETELAELKSKCPQQVPSQWR